MATTISKGRNIEILNLTLASDDDIQLGFVNAVNSVIIKARTGVDIQVRSSRGAGNYYTIPSGDSLTLDIISPVGFGEVGDTFAPNIWIRSVSATPTVEVIGIYGG